MILKPTTDSFRGADELFTFAAMFSNLFSNFNYAQLTEPDKAEESSDGSVLAMMHMYIDKNYDFDEREAFLEIFRIRCRHSRRGKKSFLYLLMH